MADKMSDNDLNELRRKRDEGTFWSVSRELLIGLLAHVDALESEIKLERAAALREAQDKVKARRFHELYESLAPKHNYETRKESAVKWEDVPPNNKNLMIAVCVQIQNDIQALIPLADAHALDKLLAEARLEEAEVWHKRDLIAGSTWGEERIANLHAAAEKVAP